MNVWLIDSNLMSWYFSDEETEASGRFCAQGHTAGLSWLTLETPLSMLYVAQSRCSTNGWSKHLTRWNQMRTVGRERARWMKLQDSSPCLPLSLCYCDSFCLLVFSGFLPVDREGKQPMQQDWKALGTEQGFFISQVIRNAQHPPHKVSLYSFFIEI